jgi:ribosomal protein RSM22 (predicted rRNA methylase)
MAAMLRNLVVKRCNWKAPIALPEKLADRRAAFLARATGPQLKRLCQKPQLSDRDAALLDVWRRLAPRHAVARRVITDCGVAPTNALVVGAGAATVAALPPFTQCTVVEATPEREAAAKALLDNPTGIEWHPDLAAVALRQPSPEQAFDFVIATDHFVNCDDPETHLAVLWGCVAENGLLAVVERESTPIREARSRLMSEGTPLEPSTAELLPQCFAEPLAGPPPRSTRKADAGTALKRRAQRVEKFASCVVRRGGVVEGGRRRRAIVTSTPLKRAGHVVVDARDDRGAERRLTLSRARLREMGTPFKDARRLTVGSVLSWDE